MWMPKWPSATISLPRGGMWHVKSPFKSGSSSGCFGWDSDLAKGQKLLVVTLGDVNHQVLRALWEFSRKQTWQQTHHSVNILGFFFPMLKWVFLSAHLFATDRGIQRRQWRAGLRSRGATLCCLGSCSSPLARSGDPRDKNKNKKKQTKASPWKLGIIYTTWKHIFSWNKLQMMALKRDEQNQIPD